MTHLFSFAICHGLYKVRRDIGRSMWGFFSRDKNLGVTILVDSEGKDLIPITIWNGHKMSLLELTKIISERVITARQRKDLIHEKATEPFKYIPSFIA